MFKIDTGCYSYDSAGSVDYSFQWQVIAFQIKHNVSCDMLVNMPMHNHTFRNGFKAEHLTQLKLSQLQLYPHILKLNTIHIESIAYTKTLCVVLIAN